MTQPIASHSGLPLLALPDAFEEGALLKTLLPRKPRVCWSVSAGHDMRPLVFFSDPIRRRAAEQGGVDPRGLPRPDLFLFTCLDSFGRGLHDLDTGQTIYRDRATHIQLESRHPLRIHRGRVPYAINPEHIEITTDPLACHDHDAALFRVLVRSLRKTYEERVWLLYLAMENLQAWDSLVSRTDLDLVALVATREGLGMGLCKRSILEHLYLDGAVQRARNPEAAPSSVVTWGDYTDALFQRAALRFHPQMRRLASYIPERDCHSPHQIYLMDPDPPIRRPAPGRVRRLRLA